MSVSKKEISQCPIDAMLSVVDGRWKGTILWRLSEGANAYRRIAPQHSRDHGENVDPPSPGSGAGWNFDETAGDNRPSLRVLLNL